MPTLFDISPPLFNDMPVWPGDTPFSGLRTWQLDEHCPVNVSRLTLSTHSGAHADAPLHYQRDGLPIGQVSLHPYLGQCRVVHCLNAGPIVSLAQLQERLQNTGLPLPSRVLIRTYHQYPLKQWDDNFPGVDPKAIEWLGQQGVCLIGVDTASLDPVQSKTLDAHHAVLRHEMAILENLLLDDVPEGDYELIALPLKLENLDASPVRAVLRILP